MATGFTIEIDERLLRRDISRVVGGFDAVRVTMTDPGEGEVIVSKRPKMPHERANKKKGVKGQKAVHGRLIAWSLSNRGHDPFAYTSGAVASTKAYLARNVERAIQKAYKTSRKQTKGMTETLLKAAEGLAWSAAERIRHGQLGTNQESYGKRKKVMQNKGIAMQKWGGQWPPYGMLTGRFTGDRKGSPGIRARHRNKARRTPNTRRPKRAPRNVFQR